MQNNIMKTVGRILPITSKRLAITVCTAASMVVLAGCASNHYDRSTGEYIDDKATVDRVEDRLGADPVYKLGSIHVTAFKGTVQLSGFVNTADQKDRAQELAKNVPGVKDVVNNITVKEEKSENR